MKKEDIYLHTYQDFREARRAILEYIEGWYNRKRIHSAIGYMIPQQKEEEELKRQNKLSTFCVQSIDISPILMTYLEDGRCSLSNNMSGNSIRSVVAGRKNWIFSDTMDGAEASMGIYTIAEMAKLHGLDPYKYMKYILEQRPTYKTSWGDWKKRTMVGQCSENMQVTIYSNVNVWIIPGLTTSGFLCLHP